MNPSAPQSTPTNSQPLEIWQYCANAPITSDLYAGRSRILFGTSDGQFHCLDPRTGKEWSLTTRGIGRTISDAGDLIYLYTDCGLVHVINPNTHDHSAVIDISKTVGMTLEQYVNLEYGRGSIESELIKDAYGDNKSRVEALTLWTCHEIFSNVAICMGSSSERTSLVLAIELNSNRKIWDLPLDLPKPPLIVESKGRIFLASLHYLVGIESLTGKLLFKLRQVGVSSISLTANSDLIVWGELRGKRFHCASIDTLETKWVYEARGDTLALPAINDEYVCFCDYSGLFHCLEVRTGRLMGTFDLGGVVFGRPLIHGNTVYLGTLKGDFFALDIVRSKLIWKIKKLAAIAGTSVVLDNVLCFYYGDGNVCAIDLDASPT